MLYSYQKTEPGIWAVGRLQNDGNWEQESKWNTQEEAAEHAHVLNDKGKSVGETEASPTASK